MGTSQNKVTYQLQRFQYLVITNFKKNFTNVYSLVKCKFWPTNFSIRLYSDEKKCLLQNLFTLDKSLCCEQFQVIWFIFWKRDILAQLRFGQWRDKRIVRVYSVCASLHIYKEKKTTSLWPLLSPILTSPFKVRCYYDCSLHLK